MLYLDDSKGNLVLYLDDSRGKSGFQCVGIFHTVGVSRRCWSYKLQNVPLSGLAICLGFPFSGLQVVVEGRSPCIVYI